MTNAHEEAKELMAESSEYIDKQTFSEEEIGNLYEGKIKFREVKE